MSSQNRKENSVLVCHCFVDSIRLRLKYLLWFKSYWSVSGAGSPSIVETPLLCIKAENALGIPALGKGP